MAHFVNVRAGAIWANLSVLLSSEMALFDQQLGKGINGDDGGTWAPASQVILGGSGLSVTGEFDATNVNQMFVASGGLGKYTSGSTLQLQGGALLSIANLATASISGQLTLVGATGSLTVNSTATVTFNAGANFNINSAVSATGAWGFTNTAAINVAGSLTVTGGFVVSAGSATYAGGYFIAYGSGGTISRAAPETILGASAQTAWRTGQLTDSAGQTLDASVDLVSVPAAASASRTVTVKHTTGTIPLVGSKIRVTWIVNNSGFGWTFQREDTTAIFSINNFAGPAWVEIVFAQYPGDVTAKWHFSAGGAQSWATGMISNVS